MTSNHNNIVNSYFGDLIDIPVYPRLLHETSGFPNYTSPPTSNAICLTPENYRLDNIIHAGRKADADGLCNSLDPNTCQILFHPDEQRFETSKIGVIFYGGAFVDPRAYSPLAVDLAKDYGLPVTIPIFNRDLASYQICESGRVRLASLAFPHVEKWIFAGHSMGGTAAVKDVASLLERNETEKIGGLAIIASYVPQESSCGRVDFSDMAFPAAIVSGTLDGIINMTNWEHNHNLLPVDDTFRMDILGGNHGYFGDYDDSERESIFGSNDGVATIPASLQQDLTVLAIVHVVSRVGLP
eukprot:CAMPEP_0197240540 /NCGR_PEP_ID=MMETSP1429-20130617/6807_1 /TAXON_ID=49237 /ORGANISM="Chaetoceros  sp., Strain UNC1202" /LENGTH=297 /DNA_ID=CAMNT_0042700203 /DNA_START=39 /DNA_END=929 /DNA_ORIENTATION=+